MITTVKISSKHQIVIPREARKQLGLSAGDQLLVEVRNGTLVMRPRPRSYTKHLEGLHREVWEGVDALQYVRDERKAWR